LWAAASDSISVKSEVNRAFVTIGERLEYRVTVTHDPSIQILSDLLPPAAKPFEMKEMHEFSEKQGKEIVEGRRVTLVSYELGEFILEPVTVRYRTAKGEEKSIQTNRLYVTIQSVEPSGAEKTDIRGPKGVVGLSREWAWLWALVAFSLVGGGAYYLWWRWKHPTAVGAGAGEAALSPEDEALLSLSRLFDSDLLRRGKLKEYYLSLSEILRRYFERRFEILAIESTTPEILRDLKEKELPTSLRAKIRETLEAADLVKFAKWKPAPTEILHTNQLAKQIVEEARPKEASPPEALGATTHGL
jgi:hypothetical protein